MYNCSVHTRRILWSPKIMLFSAEGGIPNPPDQSAMNFFASCFNDPALSPQYVHELLEKASMEMMNSMLRSPYVDRMASQAQVPETSSPTLADSAVFQDSLGEFADSRSSADSGCNNISKEVCFLGFQVPYTTENDKRSFSDYLDNFTADLALPESVKSENKIGLGPLGHRLTYTTQAREARTPRSPMHVMQRVRDLEKELYSSNRRYSITCALDRVEVHSHTCFGRHAELVMRMQLEHSQVPAPLPLCFVRVRVRVRVCVRVRV